MLTTTRGLPPSRGPAAPIWRSPIRAGAALLAGRVGDPARTPIPDGVSPISGAPGSLSRSRSSPRTRCPPRRAGSVHGSPGPHPGGCSARRKPRVRHHSGDRPSTGHAVPAGQFLRLGVPRTPPRRANRPFSARLLGSRRGQAAAPPAVVVALGREARPVRAERAIAGTIEPGAPLRRIVRQPAVVAAVEPQGGAQVETTPLSQRAGGADAHGGQLRARKCANADACTRGSWRPNRVQSRAG